MSIATAITAAQGRVADCYTAISNKGGTLPATQDLANMPTAINSISTGGTIDSLTITPTTSQQTITASGGTDGYSPITVNAVTASIDANIQASNIKSGVSILGVSGSVTELNGETRTEQLDSTSGNTYTPTTGKNAITSITVTPKNYARTVAPQTTQSIWAVPSGYSGHGNITVSPVTSAIDANIQASNIKSGVTILGVTGNYGGGGSKYGCTIDNLLGDVDANGVYQLPTDTSGDIVFTGLKKFGTYSYAMYYKFYGYTNLTHGVSFPDLEEADSQYCLNDSFSATSITSFLMPKLTKVSGISALYAVCNGTKITTASLPELIEVTANNGLRSAFSNNYFMTSFSASKLKTVSGTYALYYLCSGNITLTSMDLSALETADAGYALGYLCQSCYKLPEMRFTKLKSIAAGSVLYGAFYGCKEITDIYFNALTTTSFGSQTNQFFMFNTGTNGTAATSGNVNVHFPSNLQSTIAGLGGYPNFGATAGRVTLLFDLPSTQ